MTTPFDTNGATDSVCNDPLRVAVRFPTVIRASCFPCRVATSVEPLLVRCALSFSKKPRTGTNTLLLRSREKRS